MYLRKAALLRPTILMFISFTLHPFASTIHPVNLLDTGSLTHVYCNCIFYSSGSVYLSAAYYTDPPETIPNIPDYFFIYTFYFYVHFPSKSISFRWILGDYDTYDSIINRICKGGVIVKSLLEAVCSLCLASSAMMHWEGCSILFFGEYPFPEK